MKGVAPTAVLEALPAAPDPFAAALVIAVERHRGAAEDLVRSAAVGWTLERMAVVDRLVLLLATAELMEPEGPPVPVVMNEAVELAKTYSTEESGRFVNGVLRTVAAALTPTSTAAPTSTATPTSTAAPTSTATPSAASGPAPW